MFDCYTIAVGRCCYIQIFWRCNIKLWLLIICFSWVNSRLCYIKVTKVGWINYLSIYLQQWTFHWDILIGHDWFCIYIAIFYHFRKCNNKWKNIIENWDNKVSQLTFTRFHCFSLVWPKSHDQCMRTVMHKLENDLNYKATGEGCRHKAVVLFISLCIQWTTYIDNSLSIIYLEKIDRMVSSVRCHCLHNCIQQ